jgi:hypothetical protein
LIVRRTPRIQVKQRLVPDGFGRELIKFGKGVDRHFALRRARHVNALERLLDAIPSSELAVLGKPIGHMASCRPVDRHSSTPSDSGQIQVAAAR